MRVEKDRLLDLLESENAMLGDALASSEEQMRTPQAALSEQTLQAVSYDTIRDRISSLRMPFAKAQHNALQALLDGNTQNASAASALPETSPGVADTDEALRRIDDLSRANDAIRGAMEQAAAAGATDTLSPSCQRAMAANDALIADFQNVIAQIEAYAAASVQLLSRGTTDSTGPLVRKRIGCQWPHGSQLWRRHPVEGGLQDKR